MKVRILNGTTQAPLALTVLAVRLLTSPLPPQDIRIFQFVETDSCLSPNQDTCLTLGPRSSVGQWQRVAATGPLKKVIGCFFFLSSKETERLENASEVRLSDSFLYPTVLCTL